MRHFFVPLLAVLGLITASSMARAQDVAPYSRDLAIHHNVLALDHIETRITETIRIHTVAGAAAHRLLDVASRYPGGVPDVVSGQIVRADGSRQALAKISFTRGEQQAMLDLPDPMPGDVVTLHIEGSTRAPTLMSAVALAQVYPASERFGKVEIAVSGPFLHSVNHESDGFDVSRRVGMDGESVLFVLKAQPYRLDEPGALHPLDHASRVVLSTWRSYEQFGRQAEKAFHARDIDATGLAPFARHAVGGATDPNEKAQLLLKALVKSFGVDPLHHGMLETMPTLGQVLELKRGSRVDLARLYRALLAMEGVQADLILTNQRPLYTLPKVAIPAFDTALVYIPSSNLYVDPSAQVAAFGALHPAYAGKMGLKLTGNPTLFVISPRLNAQDNRTRVFSEMTVSADGAVEGNTRIEGHGSAGLVLRQNVAQLASTGTTREMQAILRRQNMVGEAKLSQADTSHFSDPFVVDMSFRIQGETGRDKAVRVPIAAGPRLIRPPQVDLITVLREEREQPFACHPQIFEQDIVLHLPPTDVPYGVPTNVSVKVAHASYEAAYALKGNVLTARRRFVLENPGFICTLETVRDLAPAIKAAGRDMRRMLGVRGGDD